MLQTNYNPLSLDIAVTEKIVFDLAFKTGQYERRDRCLVRFRVS